MITISDLLILSQIPGIGSNRLRNLISHLKSTEAIFSSTAKQLSEIEGFSKTLSVEIINFLKDDKLKVAKEMAAKQLTKLNKCDGQIITFWDRKYPDLLKKIYDPPPYLFLKGELKDTDKYAIGIVGTRHPSSYGKMMAEIFGREFAELGITTISGLARGIDTVVHSTTIKGRGRTIAVLGSGIDIIYPPENRLLADDISEHGVIISEFEMGTKPDACNFPRRNRIISGLSLGTIVIETNIDGGAMITASIALDQNREVFAIPGNINTKTSVGCNMLIKSGRAKLVENIDDIISELAAQLKPVLKAKSNNPPNIELNIFEEAILRSLSYESKHIDTIAEETNLSTSDILVNLLSLEFKGIVRQLAGKMFIKT